MIVKGHFLNKGRKIWIEEIPSDDGSGIQWSVSLDENSTLDGRHVLSRNALPDGDIFKALRTATKAWVKGGGLDSKASEVVEVATDTEATDTAATNGDTFADTIYGERGTSHIMTFIKPRANRKHDAANQACEHHFESEPTEDQIQSVLLDYKVSLETTYKIRKVK